ncbi:MAG: NAD-dependent protein deacylase [Acidobacteria bacterium]|nr:MAG: NAD-dependent protein deacylase [Acidobacteriota bacterium]
MEVLRAAVDAIRKEKPRKIVVLTGAGVSADSGIPTFRGAGGLWRNYRAEDLATPEAFARSPLLVWEWYEWRRSIVREAEPNAAHRAIASLAKALVVTQNVDGLHQRAGSQNVIELHGNLFRTRCVRDDSRRDAIHAFGDLPPHCECGALLRPDVVWFGETLPEGAFARASHAVSEADLLLVIGTSGVVFPAAGLVSLHDGLSIEINPQVSAISSACTFAIAAKAAEAAPAIIEAIHAGTDR